MGYQHVLNGVKHFGYYAADNDSITLSEATLNMMEQVAIRLNLPQGSKVLDAGCGEGATAFYLAKTRKYLMSGIDILDFNIDRATKKAKELKIPADFLLASYDNLPFKDKSFDGVYTLETLVHAENANLVLKEFYRVLKSGGRLVLFEYSIPKIEDLDKRQRHIFKIIADGSVMRSFLSFNYGVLPNKIKKAGFILESSEDLTERMIPSLKRFYRLGLIPYQIFRILGLRKKFVNTTSGVELYRYRDVFRYNAYIAHKP
jgi:sterol 24-C-methyltransferase